MPTTALQPTPNPSSKPTPTPTPRPTPTPVPTPTYSALAPGAKGDDVRDLQERLVELGYAIGSADGQYGGKTKAAVKAVQVLAGLRVTGTADEETQEVIWGRYAPTPQPKPTPTPRPTPRPTPEPEPVDEGTDYILNRNTRKFHYSWCSSVDQMKESNKIYFTGTSEQAQRKGYVPCKRCNP
ncbi:peptidoglycan-binding protein [Bacillota bacterium Meth-B3]